MTLKVTDPINVTEAVLSASDIAEPDASIGEVEWSDPSVLGEFGAYSSVRQAIVEANDGFMYAFGWAGAVTKIDPSNNTVTEFGSYTGRISSAVLALDGNIYCSGNFGYIIKLDVAGQSISTLGSFAGSCESISLASDGNIYGAGTNGFAVKLDVSGQSVSTFGSHSNAAYRKSAVGGDGNIYVAGRTDILKIDVASQSISQFGSYSGLYEGGATGPDGNVYFVGTSNVLKLDVSEQTLSTFGAYTGSYIGADVDNEGVIKCTGYKNANGTSSVLDIYTGTKSTRQYGSYDFDLLAVAKSSNGSMYAVGRKVGVTGGVIEIPEAYSEGDQVVLTSNHLKYQCLSYTYENPLVGATEGASATWIKIGSTNKWAMFDGLKNDTTESASDFTVTLTPGTYVNTLAVLGFSGVESIRVEVDDSDDINIYDKTLSTADFSSIYDHYTYVFYQILELKQIIFQDLPPLPNTTIRVTFSGVDMVIGELIHGFAINIGDLVTSNTRSDRFRYREQEYNDFGYPVGAGPITVELNTYDVLVPKLNNPSIQRLLDRITGENALWVGDIGGGQQMVTYGFFERSPIPFTMPNHINYQITVRASV